MSTVDEQCEFRKGFERGMEGKEHGQSFGGRVFRSIVSLFGFEPEATGESVARQEGFSAGKRERRRRQYCHGETMCSTVKSMFGFDERNVDRGSGFQSKTRG